ncbi:MAG: SRPBCC family protein [Cyclobacteriaceae bacterium]
MKKIIVKCTIQQPIQRVWKLWTTPEHIMNWNHANAEWHTPRASNDLKTGGAFVYHMAAKDGSMAFDFGGTYTKVVTCDLIAYQLADGREVMVSFRSVDDSTEVIETFDPDDNPIDMQQQGWQAILNNFKAYAERVS